MYYACPTCEREFGEGGFCPYDGSSLTHSTANTVAESNRLHDGMVTDDLATRPHLKSGTISGSAVANVLKKVLEDRNTDAEDPTNPGALVGANLDGRYRIEKLIGEGGMGMVYLAKHIVIEKLVAIKVLRAEVAVDDDVVKRFVQEARAASRIGHPNIVDVTDFGTTKDGLTYQVMEYLEGQTLTKLLATVVPLPLSRGLNIIAQMCRALGAAHAKGIVHRDLKPDNIFLVSRDGREDFVKIVDFGIAKVPPRENSNEARLTEVGTVFGTPEYMSPEQASGRTDVDLRADVYAVGTILYEMLVGNVPHKGETTVRTLAMQILDHPPRPRNVRPDLNISEDLEKAVMRALEKDRDRRFQTMQELLDALVEATSKTELDLPLLLKQERVSSRQIQQAQQYDTIPEIDLDDSSPPRQSRESTSVRGVERSARSTSSTRSRRRSRVTDPVFLRRGSSASVPIFNPDDSEDTAFATKSKSKLAVLALVAMLMGGVLATFILIRGTRDTTAVAAADIDGSVTLLSAQASDASPTRESTDADIGMTGDARSSDKQIEEHPDSKTDPATVALDRENTTNKNGADTPLPKGDAVVTVITRPRGARLIIDKAYAGPGGTNIQRTFGTELTVRCKLKGYSDGTVEVTFDGKTEVYLCKLKKLRTKRCVKGMKNPFDDCPK